jgi:hypothetical protein
MKDRLTETTSRRVEFWQTMPNDERTLLEILFIDPLEPFAERCRERCREIARERPGVIRAIDATGQIVASCQSWEDERR